MEKKELSFEEAVKKLETIAKELENQNVDLNKSLKLYEEGIGLVRYCNSMLENAERKIKMLAVNENGEVEEKDFIESAQNIADGERI